MMNGHGASKVLRFLRCTFWDQSYCLDMSWVRGIQRGDQLIKQPGDRGFVGWLQSDGGNIPVYRCTTLLGHTPRPCMMSPRDVPSLLVREVTL